MMSKTNILYMDADERKRFRSACATSLASMPEKNVRAEPTVAELEIALRHESFTEELKYAIINCLMRWFRDREEDKHKHKEFLTYISRLLQKTEKDYEPVIANNRT